MSPFRLIVAVVLASFLALFTVSCDQNKPAEKTGDKKVEQPTTPPPSGSQQPGSQQPGGTQQPSQTPGTKPAQPGGTAPSQ